MGDGVTDSARPGGDSGRAGLRALFEDAAEGLNPGEREVIELELRQGFRAGEVAAVLGVSRGQAHRRLALGRDRLEACLEVLLAGRAGRDECRELQALLAGWDGRLTVLLGDRAHRHIRRCPTCTARRTRELRLAVLLNLPPAVALAAGAAESFRLAPGAPLALRAHTISLANGHGPGAAAHSAAVLARAGTFGREGFPKPAHAPGTGLSGPRGFGGLKTRLRLSRRGQVAAAAVTVLAAVFALAAGSVRSAPQGGFRPAPAVLAPRPPAARPSPAARQPASAGPVPGSPGPGVTRVTHNYAFIKSY